MTGETIVVSAAVIADPQGRILTVRKKNTQLFQFPGGKPEPEETAEQACIREVREELGMRITNLQSVGTFVANAANEANHTVTAHVFQAVSSDSPRVAAEIAECSWQDPGAPSVQLAPLLKEEVFPALLNN